MSSELQVSPQFLCVTKKRFFELILYLYHLYVASSVIISVYIGAGILIGCISQYTTATAEGTSVGMHSVIDYKQSKQKLILTYAILLCHFMAVLCFPPQLFIIVNNLLFLTFCCK